jgi:hypothetical protein
MHSTSKVSRIAALLGAACCLTTAAQAQKLAPGLWENSSTMHMQAADGKTSDAMAKMQQQMVAMPPEQRKMVEEMMAKQGVGMGTKPNTVRVCISPEQASRGEVPQDDSRCKRDMLERTGNTLRFKFSCEGPPSSTGEGSYTFVNDKSYTGTMKVTTSGGKGGGQGGGTMDMQSSGRWVSADCGTLKPRP